MYRWQIQRSTRPRNTPLRSDFILQESNNSMTTTTAMTDSSTISPVTSALTANDKIESTVAPRVR